MKNAIEEQKKMKQTKIEQDEKENVHENGVESKRDYIVIESLVRTETLPR